MQGRPPKRPNRRNNGSHVEHSLSDDMFTAVAHACVFKILAACDLESMRLIAQTQACWRDMLRPSTGGADFMELWALHTNHADLAASLHRITRESEPLARLCKLSSSAETSPWGRACALRRSVRTSDTDLVQSYQRVKAQVHPECLMHADAEAAVHELACALLSTLTRTAVTISEQLGRTLCYTKDMIITDEIPTVWYTPGCITEALLHAAIKLVVPGELGNHAMAEAQKAVMLYSSSSQREQHRRVWHADFRPDQPTQEATCGLTLSVGAVVHNVMLQEGVRGMDGVIEACSPSTTQCATAKNLAAVLEYIVAECLELAGHESVDELSGGDSMTIRESHLQRAMASDPELAQLETRCSSRGPTTRTAVLTGCPGLSCFDAPEEVEDAIHEYSADVTLRIGLFQTARCHAPRVEPAAMALICASLSGQTAAGGDIEEQTGELIRAIATLAVLTPLDPHSAGMCPSVQFGHVSTALALRGQCCRQFSSSHFNVELSALFDKALTPLEPFGEFLTAELVVDYGLLRPLLQSQALGVGSGGCLVALSSETKGSLYAVAVLLAAAGMSEQLGILLARHEGELLDCPAASAALLLAAQLAAIRGHASVIKLLGSAAACTSHAAWNGLHPAYRISSAPVGQRRRATGGLLPSPLMLAVSSDSAECVRLILKAGSDVNAAAVAEMEASMHKSGKENSAVSGGRLLWGLIHAAMLGHVHVLRVLLGAGATHAESMIAATHFAATNGHQEAVEFLMSALLSTARKRWFSDGGAVVTRDLANEFNFAECAAAIHPAEH